MYSDLSGKVKVNHIFSCSGDDLEVMFMELHQSNLEEHVSLAHKVGKKLRKLCSPVEVRAYSAHLKRMNYVGMNAYKVIEMWKNYRPNVPPEFHGNILYIEPTAAEWAKVKVERLDRSEFWAANRLKKYATKEAIESVVIDSYGGGVVFFAGKAFSHNINVVIVMDSGIV
jgi:hypothetical protein